MKMSNLEDQQKKAEDMETDAVLRLMDCYEVFVILDGQYGDILFDPIEIRIEKHKDIPDLMFETEAKDKTMVILKSFSLLSSAEELMKEIERDRTRYIPVIKQKITAGLCYPTDSKDYWNV
jgi:hypothetical protein